jgi:hypothetical protein
MEKKEVKGVYCVPLAWFRHAALLAACCSSCQQDACLRHPHASTCILISASHLASVLQACPCTRLCIALRAALLLRPFCGVPWHTHPLSERGVWWTLDDHMEMHMCLTTAVKLLKDGAVTVSGVVYHSTGDSAQHSTAPPGSVEPCTDTWTASYCGSWALLACAKGGGCTPQLRTV